MTLIILLLLIAALVCFLLAAWNKPSRIQLGWLGLAFWVAATLLPSLLRAG